MRLLASIFCVWAIGAAAAPGLRQPSVYGDARFGMNRTDTATNANSVTYSVSLRPGDYDGITITAWGRVPEIADEASVVQSVFWCPDPVVKDAPDLLDGAGAFGTASGTNLTDLGGSITVPSFPFQPYTDAHLVPLSNSYPRGVYTLAGWASNAVTVTLGGTDYTVGPGDFNRNALPGVTDSVVISGSGLVSIGISRTPGYRFFSENSLPVSFLIPKVANITNELAFCAYRFSLSGPNQILEFGLGNLGGLYHSRSVTNAAPLSGRFSGSGMYRLTFTGRIAAPFNFDLFDIRVLPWCLTDKELERVHFNGVQEINRRGIPRWK